MKKLPAFLLVAVIVTLPVHATEVSLYNEDGEGIVVRSKDAERMRGEGWYYFDEVHTTVYSEDGRSVSAVNSRLDKWMAAGWREDPSEVRTTLYSEDGSELTVWNAEVEASLQQGWHRTAQEVRTTLFGSDGSEITVWNAEVGAFLQEGWRPTAREVQTMIYSNNGDEKLVWNAEVDGYLSKGWSLDKPKPIEKKADGDGPMVALTFDDGPGPYTDRILACLIKYNAKATFFVVGDRLEKYKDELRREAELGMEIGNHSWSHAQLTALSSGETAKQILDTNNKIRELTGAYPSTLRPPYGSHDATVRAAANVPVILWSVDTEDWRTKNADATYKAVTENVKDGDIILMHDIHSATADAVERIVPELVSRGYRLVTVSELGKRAGDLKAGQAYRWVK